MGHNRTMRSPHTMLRVGHLQRANDFYIQCRGMNLLPNTDNQQYKDSHVFHDLVIKPEDAQLGIVLY